MPNSSTKPAERISRLSAKPTRDRIIAAATDLFSDRSMVPRHGTSPPGQA
jgi:hypothetical protein